MPFYEYRCQSCHFETEVMQSIKADPLTKCPECGAEQLRRKIFPVGMIFKGDGFYSTEYRDSDYAAAAKSEEESSKSSSGESNKSGESSVSSDNKNSLEGTSSNDTSNNDTSGGSTSASDSDSPAGKKS